MARSRTLAPPGARITSARIFRADGSAYDAADRDQRDAEDIDGEADMTQIPGPLHDGEPKRLNRLHQPIDRLDLQIAFVGAQQIVAWLCLLGVTVVRFDILLFSAEGSNLHPQ